MLEEYKAFAVRGNVVDMAVGIIIGAAFNGVVQSLVKDVLMPPLGLLMGDVDFANLFLVLKEGTPAAPYATLEAARSAGAVTINAGVYQQRDELPDRHVCGLSACAIHQSSARAGGDA